MKVTKTELYDRYYSVYPDKAKLYRGDTEMPNHCHNRVTFYPAGDNIEKAIEDIKAIKQMFEDEECFTQIIPEPDWVNTPLMSKDVQEYSFSKPRGKVGELPQYVEDPWRRLVFKSTGQSDDRWYDWRVQNWDTKWDAYDVEVTDDDPDCTEIQFNTAWSPPEAICSALREQYPDVDISWFYDEPGCEIAGYL